MATPGLQKVKRLAASTLVLTVLMLAGLDLFITVVRPLRFFNATGFTPLDQNPLVSKLPEFLASHDNPDVLILGSSLLLVPAVRCDDQFEGRKTRYDGWYRRNHINDYRRANYFESLLRKRAGRDLHVTNLGVIASIMSDHCLILEKTLASGKRPGLVLVGIAPRDFLDNYRSQVEKTPVYQVLAGINCIGDLLANNASPDDVRDFAVGTIWHFYKVKADYRTFATSLVSHLTGHPVSLYDATLKEASHKEIKAPLPAANDGDVQVGLLEKVEPIWEAKPNTLQDLDIYKRVYNPPNTAMFTRQEKYLERIVNAARKASVPVVLVNMPLTSQNKELLDKAIYKRYRDTVARVSRETGTVLIDLDQNPYELTDFEDSCHLSGRGGKKFYADLERALFSNKLVSPGLCARKSLTGSR